MIRYSLRKYAGSKEIHLYDLDLRRFFCGEDLGGNYTYIRYYKASSEMLRQHCLILQNGGKLVCGRCVSSLYGRGKHSSKFLHIVEILKKKKNDLIRY